MTFYIGAHEILVSDNGRLAVIYTKGFENEFVVSSDVGTALELALELLFKASHETKLTEQQIACSFDETAA